MPGSGRKKGKRGRVSCLVMIAISCVLLLVGEAARLWLALDVFSQFRLQLLLGTLAFLIGFFMPRARVLTALVILIAGLVAIGLYPQILSERALPDVAADGSGKAQVHLMSFNMSLQNRMPELVLAEVERVKPDILALIEIAPGEQQLISSLKRIYPYSTDCFAQKNCYVAIFSRIPFTVPQLAINWRTPQLAAAQFGPELGGVTVMGVHTLRFPHARPQMIQYRALAGILTQIGGRKIVMGDFNATSFSVALRSFEKVSRLRRLTFLPSWPSTIGLPQLGIDHIFASRDIALVEAARIGRFAGSDHYPVQARLAIPRP